MKTENSPTKWQLSPLVWGTAFLLVAVCVFISIPHRTQVIEAHITLQTGKKFSVKCTLQSRWGWCEPDSLAKMEVTLDGQSLAIDKSAWHGVHPVKASQPPIIVEKGGFPEVILLGKSGSSLKQANWLFLNYSLSQRQLITGQGKVVAYYSTDSVSAQSIPPPNAAKPAVAQALFSKPIALAKLQSPATYNGMIHIVDMPKSITGGELTPNK